MTCFLSGRIILVAVNGQTCSFHKIITTLFIFNFHAIFSPIYIFSGNTLSFSLQCIYGEITVLLPLTCDIARPYQEWVLTTFLPAIWRLLEIGELLRTSSSSTDIFVISVWTSITLSQLNDYVGKHFLVKISNSRYFLLSLKNNIVYVVGACHSTGSHRALSLSL